MVESQVEYSDCRGVGQDPSYRAGSRLALLSHSKASHSKAAKHIHCAQNAKAVRLCYKFKKNLSNIFPKCHIYSKMAAILTLKVTHGSKVKKCADFSESCIKLSVLYKDSKKKIIVSWISDAQFLTNVRLWPYVGLRSQQICTWGQKIAPILMKHT